MDALRQTFSQESEVQVLLMLQTVLFSPVLLVLFSPPVKFSLWFDKLDILRASQTAIVLRHVSPLCGTWDPNATKIKL